MSSSATAPRLRPLAGSALAAALILAGLGTASALPERASTGPSAPTARAAAAPNVILVKTDDQVWDNPTRMAKFMPRTVAFFRANGVSYKQSRVSSPSCCQSRASTFVGRYPHNEGVISQGLGHILDTRGSIAAYLDRRGYTTGLYGKYLNRVPRAPHFDEYITIMGSCDSELADEYCTEPTKPAWYYNFLATYPDGSVRKILGDPATGANYNTTWVGARAGEFLGRALTRRAADGTPFYLEFDPTAPHLHDEQNTARNMTEPKYRSLAVPGCAAPPVENDRSDKPAYVQAFPLTDSYSYGTICPVAQRTLRSLDDWFGATIDRLAAAGELGKTLIVFTSDNGLMYGEHGLSRKYVPYDPSVRVPLMIAYPGVFAPGTTAAANAGRALVSNLDILPTILSVTGTPVDPALPKIDGISLVAKPGGHTVVLSEYWRDPGWSPAVPAPIPTWAALYDRRYTFAITYDKDGRPVTQELYDRVADPREMTNLIPVRAGATSPTYDVKRWTARLNTERRCTGTAGTRPCH